jgi:hypothetical protein
MLKKVACTFVALVASASLALAANIPLLTGPQDSSQLIASLNQVIQAVNSGVVGKLVGDTTASATTTGTSEQILKTYTLPANTVANSGDSIRVTCSGTTGATGNNKTMKLYFGASSITTPTAATNAKGWQLSYIVTRSAAATQSFAATGIVDTTAVTPTVAAGTDDFTTALTIKCTGTDGTSAANDIVVNQFLVEMIK